MYRPQFAYPLTPAQCEDERCHYSFDGTNVPRFQGNIPGLTTYTKVPLVLDQDADFFIRGIQISPTTLLIGIQDPSGHPIVFPTATGLPPVLQVPLWAQSDGAGLVTLDSDNWGIFCPASGCLLAYVQNTLAGSVAGPVITLHGVKRFKGAGCK